MEITDNKSMSIKSININAICRVGLVLGLSWRSVNGYK